MPRRTLECKCLGYSLMRGGRDTESGERERERERELEMRLGEYLLLLRLPCKHEFPWPQGAGTLGESERVGETGAMKCPEPRFHYKCISNWLTKRNTCCICNGPAVLSAPHFT